MKTLFGVFLWVFLFLSFSYMCGCAPATSTLALGSTYTRHAPRGPTPSEADAIIAISIREGLCVPQAFTQTKLNIELLPLSYFFGLSIPMIKQYVVGYYVPGVEATIKIATLSGKPCRTLIHELAHHCQGARHDKQWDGFWKYMDKLETVVFNEVCE